MNQDEIMVRLQGIFKDVFGDDELIINVTTSPNDIDDWDSLEHINLIAAIEADFHVRFNMEEIGKLQNVGDMLVVLKQKITN